MKAFFIYLCLLLALFAQPVLAAGNANSDTNASVRTEASFDYQDGVGGDYSETGSGQTWFQKALDVLVTIIMILAIAAMIGHMIYVKYKLTPRYKTQFTLSDFKHQRIAKGQSELASPEENQQAMQTVQSILDGWKVTSTDLETGEEFRQPTKIKHIRASVALLDQAIEIAPTEQEVIDEMNSYAAIINTNEERSFAGSKVLIWIAVGVAIVPLFFGAWQMLPSMALGIAAYYLASLRPAFLLLKEREGKIGFMNSVLVGVFGMIGAAQTVRTVTTYTDGSKDVDDDHSQHWIALAFGVAIILMLAILIFFWSIFSYLRNYVLYF